MWRMEVSSYAMRYVGGETTNWPPINADGRRLKT
jgi:hypothetical protein